MSPSGDPDDPNTFWSNALLYVFLLFILAVQIIPFLACIWIAESANQKGQYPKEKPRADQIDPPRDDTKSRQGEQHGSDNK